jgi:hypothetical protein
MLRRRGICVSRKRVARLMRRQRISGLIKRRRGTTTIRASRPRRTWCGLRSGPLP